MAKCYDLEAACKQNPLADSEASVRVILVSLKCFRIHALPFGAVGSVPQFNRAAAATMHVAVRSLKLPCLSYFDDFPLDEPAPVLPHWSCRNSLSPWLPPEIELSVGRYPRRPAEFIDRFGCHIMVLLGTVPRGNSASILLSRHVPHTVN